MPATEIRKHAINFAIGFFAGLCAAFVPRMLVMLGGNSMATQLFPSDYIIVGLIFSVIIGGVAAILEQAKSRSARDRFMSALGLPALLAGALNTGTAANNQKLLETKNNQLVTTIQKQNNIKSNEEAIDIQPLTSIHGQQNLLAITLIPTAHAEEDSPTPTDNGLSLGLQAKQLNYVIVLDKSDDKSTALEKAKFLRNIIPKATVVQSGEEFIIIDSINKKTKSDAVLEAIKLKNENQLNPVLQQVK